MGILSHCCRVPWQTEDVNLERHFGQFGDVLEAQIMRERYTGKSRGFGFITFANAADAQKAIAADHLIDGRRCEAKFALPEGKVGSARTTRIFVARIPSSVTDFQFRAYFEQVSAIISFLLFPKMIIPFKNLPHNISFNVHHSSYPTIKFTIQHCSLESYKTRICPKTPANKATEASALSPTPLLIQSSVSCKARTSSMEMKSP